MIKLMHAGRWIAQTICCAVVLSMFPVLAAGAESPDVRQARQILEATGVDGGLVVHLGCGDGKLTAALRPNRSYRVHGLDADPANIEQARRHLQSQGLYGPVSVERFRGERLPYADNLVNLLVTENLKGVPMDEVLRVLVPNGVAYVKQDGRWTKTVKPRPAEMDEWTHYMHDATGNAVAQDTIIGPPRRMQWVGSPRWSRHHDHMASLSALVSSNGRIFYIMDEGPRDAILLPARWMLIARDAFNGTILWKRPIDEWNTHLWPLKSGPNQLPRRLVALGDRVYVTMGIDAPLSVLDAATGKTIKTYEGTEHTDEIIADDGVLFLLVAESPNKWKAYRPNSTYVWDNTRRANTEWAWDRAQRRLMAVRAENGEVLWNKECRVAPLTLATDGRQVFFYNGEKVVCLNRTSGKELWTSEPVVRKSPFPTGYGPTLVVHDGVVLLSIENRSMTALSAADGKTLWTAPHHRGGHMSPDDMLIIDGLVWSGDVGGGGDSGVFTGRDIKTGKVKSEFPPDVKPPWFHHRCYRSRATDKYFLASRTGIEFIDLKAKHWDINHWVRGGCLYGFMPCNGLLYAPPHSCGCFLESKLFGFNALAAAGSGAKSRKVADDARLERGPLYDAPWTDAADAKPGDWPTYRRDAQRSGSGKTAVPANLKHTWQADLGGRLSSVTVAGGKVFVAAMDTHTVHALDADSGKKAWSYTVGGPVDSPPTIYRGRVLFGSADGWVYCLRATDGGLVWRFRAAPEERRVMAYEQLESAWPVSGSVLVHNGVVYCVAGRSAFLDGGMRLLRLDPKTGRKLSETVMDERDPETGKNLQADMKGQDMPVALPDVLSCDGQSIYMRAQAFDLEGVRRNIAPMKLGWQRRRKGDAPAESEDQAKIQDHLFSRSGFLDDSWFFRSYWIYGKAVDSNYGGWLRPGHFAPSGRLMVFDDARVYGFDRKPEYLCNASVQEYYLYGADREVSDESFQRVRAAVGRINAASRKKGASSSDWATRKKFPLTDQNVAGFKWAEGCPAIQARAMVQAGQTLFVAGPPDVVNEEDVFRNPDDPMIKARLAAQTAALEGRMGGKLLAVSAADGKVLAAWELGAAPTFDGMAAAGGRLYLTAADGKLLCLGSKGTPLAPAEGVELKTIDISVKPPPPPPKPAPSMAKDFAKVVHARVTRSKLGYRLSADAKQLGLAVKKLPAPLRGKITFKGRLQCAGGDFKNGFFVFGDAPDDKGLVKCGLRFIQGKAVIVEGPLDAAVAAAKDLPLDENKLYEILVTVDLTSGQVTMKTEKTTVTATLDRPPKTITHVGYAVLNAVTDFSPMETSTEAK